MSNDEELVFGADEEPVNNETESSSVEQHLQQKQHLQRKQRLKRQKQRMLKLMRKTKKRKLKQRLPVPMQ